MKWLCAALAWTLGCSGSHRATGDEPDASSPAPEQAEQACSDFAVALCRRRWECIPQVFVHGHGFGDSFGTEARCVERMTLACRGWQNLPGALATPAALRACAAQVADLECRTSTQTLTRPTAGCEFEQGSSAAGAACEIGLQCSNGRCETSGAADSLRCAEGAAWWQTPDTLGTPCTTSDECAVDLVCFAGACAEPALAGEPCGAEQGVCAEYAELRCADSGLCALPAASDGVCGLVDLREYMACESGDCVGHGDRGQGYCAPYAADGEPCELSGPRCLYPARCAQDRCSVPGLR